MEIILWIWCLPQNLVGLIVKIFTKARKVGDHYEYDVQHGSVSLGEFVFLCPSHWGDATTLAHENGHREQSRRLGWLYLLIIGLPSIVWCGCFEWYVNYFRRRAELMDVAIETL